MDPHRLAELRSLELHRHIARAIVSQPELVDGAKARIEKWADKGTLDRRIAARWIHLLSGPIQTLVELLVADDETMRDLRQSTPFTFVVTPQERWRIWREVRERAERDEAA